MEEIPVPSEFALSAEAKENLQSTVDFFKQHFKPKSAAPRVDAPVIAPYVPLVPPLGVASARDTDILEDDGMNEEKFDYVDESNSDSEEDAMEVAQIVDEGKGVGLPEQPNVVDSAAAIQSRRAEEKSRKRQLRKRTGVDADQLYDPAQDDKDEKWVEKMRQQLLPREFASSSVFACALRELESMWSRKTDAVLSCPCCFMLLSVDCQRYAAAISKCALMFPSRHERFMNQFRAMFVTNCTVVNTEVIKYKKKVHRKHVSVYFDVGLEKEQCSCARVLFRAARCPAR